MVVGKLIERAIDDLLTQVGAPIRGKTAAPLASPPVRPYEVILHERAWAALAQAVRD